jgi:transglutaminase-like putative cysteine protease
VHFAIRFLTEYRYDAPVTDNLNALRVRPATTSTQRCDEFHTRIEPEARVSRHLDYFGTEVLEFGIPTSHEQLTIDVRARVVTSPPPDPPEGSWESLLSPAYVDAAGEFALPWQDQPLLTGLDDLHDALDADSPLQTLELLCELVPDRFEYRPGATYVGSTVRDLLEMQAGVCQDFVHLSLVLLRRRGIAARYVSGYLWAAPEDHGTDSLEVDTHAIAQQRRPRRARVGQRRPDQPAAGRRRDAREDRPRALLLRRATGQGALHGRRHLGAERGGDDVAAGSADERAGVTGRVRCAGDASDRRRGRRVSRGIPRSRR